jgi:Eukaryotic glutathione synthase, ATP binding domain
VQVNCLCELGIYGIFLCDSDANAESPSASTPADTSSTVSAPYINRYGGYLLRVKPAVSDEGGVAAGYAVLSSPDLV